MSSNTDVEFTSRKTNRRKSLQQKQQLDNIDIKAISINDDAKKRRKTINVVHKPINTSSDDAAINNSISYDNEMKKLNKITNIDLDEIKKLWKIGTLVEARDLHDNWYKSRIIEVDESFTGLLASFICAAAAAVEDSSWFSLACSYNNCCLRFSYV